MCLSIKKNLYRLINPYEWGLKSTLTNNHFFEINFILDLKRDNSNHILSASSDNTMCLWNLNNEKSNYLAGHTNDVIYMVDLKDYNEDYIASSSADNNIKIWSLKERNTVLKLSGHISCVNKLLHLKKLSNNLLLSCSHDASIRLWNLISGKQEFCFKAHEHTVTSIIHPYIYNKNWIISAGLDRIIRLWEIQTFESEDKLDYKGILIKELAEHNDGMNDLIYLKGYLDNKYFLSASKDNKIKLWDLTTKCSIMTYSTKGEVIVLKHLRKYNVKLFASGGTDKKIKIWDASTGDCIQILFGLTKPSNIVYPKEIDEEIIVVSDEKHIKVFNFVNGTLLKSLINAHDDLINNIMYSRKKEIIVTGCVDSNIKIWKLIR